jgi:hypothetical protein
MGSWKIGYANGLDSVANEAAGKALYDPWCVNVITLSTKSTKRAAGQVTGIAETILTDTGNFVLNAYAGGFIKMRSGSAQGNVYKVDSNTVNALTCETGTTMVTDGVAINDYYEVISGSTTFTFPAERNPIRKDYKRIVKGTYMRFPYYDGGIAISLGCEPDDFVVMAFLTSESQFKDLGMLLNNKIDYAGYDANYTIDECAPLILEEGTHDATHQYLVYFKDYKIVKDGKFGGYIEIMLHFEAIGMSSYRGL